MDYPLLIDDPMVSFLHPTDYRFIIPLGNLGVSKHSMNRPSLYRFNDFGRRGKVHIRHPHRKDILSAEYLIIVVPFQGPGIVPFNNGVESVAHLKPRIKY